TEMFASAALVIVLGWKFAHVRQAEERRRLRWLFTGCIVATVPVLLYKAVERFVIANDPAAMRDSPVRAIVNIAQVLAPISLAYAILKRQILDISVVVRRGLQYLLARNALTTLSLLPLAGVGYTIVANRDRTVGDALFANPTYLVLTVIALVSLSYRTTLRQ